MNISEAIRYFKVTPQIVRAGKETTVTIKSLDPKKGFLNGMRYKLRYLPVDRCGNNAAPLWYEMEVVAADNSITFTQLFQGEQEHYVYVEGIDVTKNIRFSLYSLEEDLFGRVPMKGDLHMHSNNSDGSDYAPHVPAMCRKIGFDFMALTDHHRYAPSIEAIAAYKDAAVDLIMMPGEEVHPEGNNAHMINFGGKISINDYMREHKEEYESALDEILRTDKTLEEVDPSMRRICASCIWCFRKIKENAGLGIFCHPYWYVDEGCQNFKDVNDYMKKYRPQDAEELVGGFFKYQTFSNDLEIARFMQDYWEGRRVGIVGVSDAHATEQDELFGWYYTIVFAEKADGAGVIDAIKNCYSVAVTHLSNQNMHIHGDFRLVKYAFFLAENYFPMHDEMCAEEGYLMYKYWSGSKDPKAAEMLRIVHGQTEEYYRNAFGK